MGLPRYLLGALGTTLLWSAAHAADLGAIVGLITNSAGAPVAHATVTAVRVDGSSTRATISGADGLYSFADLPPGTWSVSVQAAGAPGVSARSLIVVAGEATRRDLAMNTAPAPGGPAAA